MDRKKELAEAFSLLSKAPFPELKATLLKNIYIDEKGAPEKKNVTFRFTSPVVVQTAYFTVYKKDGQIYFRKDIYGYDNMIENSVKDDGQSSFIEEIEETPLF